jgi:hypothetical protein
LPLEILSAQITFRLGDGSMVEDRHFLQSQFGSDGGYERENEAGIAGRNAERFASR